MQVEAILKYTKISPQKARLVADKVRGKSVEEALTILKFLDKKASILIRKLLESAMANAENNQGADIDELKISQIVVDQAPFAKRMMPRAKGRSNRILKRYSHIKLMLADLK